MKQGKRIVPECQIVPGMGSAIDYAELIKRDSQTECQTIETKNLGQSKKMVKTRNTKLYKRS